MSNMRVLTPPERGSLIIAVGNPSDIAAHALERWGDALRSPQATTYFNNYISGASQYFENTFGRTIQSVSANASIFWASQNWPPSHTGASIEGVIINLAGVGFRITPQQIKDVGDSIKEIVVQASRNRMPRLKKGEARAARPLGAPIEEQLQPFTGGEFNHALIIDDRIQSGQSLQHLIKLLRERNIAVKAAVGHSEMPLEEAKKLFGDNLFAEIFNFRDQQEQTDWEMQVRDGIAKPVIGEELQDLLGCSPAGGTVVCSGYLDAHEDVIRFHRLVKDRLFKGVVGNVAKNSSISVDCDAPITESYISDALGDSLDSLVNIADRARFFKHLTERCNQRVKVERQKRHLKDSDQAESREFIALDKTTRWGADDIDLLFGGVLTLKAHPEFSTRIPDIRRIGNLWPFKKTNTLDTVRAMTDVEWARYSLDDIQRSILLIDQLQGEFSTISAKLIPQLAPLAVMSLMHSRGITNPVDQLRELERTLEEQIRTHSITPLVTL